MKMPENQSKKKLLSGKCGQKNAWAHLKAGGEYPTFLLLLRGRAQALALAVFFLCSCSQRCLSKIGENCAVNHLSSLRHSELLKPRIGNTFAGKHRAFSPEFALCQFPS